jgi:hypothetical protein
MVQWRAVTDHYPLDRRHRFPPEVVAQAAWLLFPFTSEPTHGREPAGYRGIMPHIKPSGCGARLTRTAAFWTFSCKAAEAKGEPIWILHNTIPSLGFLAWTLAEP